jgi:hypothetical protein
MRQLALLARFLIFPYLLFGIATAGLCFQTAILLDWIFIPPWFYLFMFSNTILLCSLYDLYIKKRTTNPTPNSNFSSRERPCIIFFLITSFPVSGYLAMKLTGFQAGWLLIMGLLIIAFCFRIRHFEPPGKFKVNNTVKLLLPVIVCTTCTTVIPATFIPYGFDTKFWWLLANRFFYLLAICILLATRYGMADMKSGSGVASLSEGRYYNLMYVALVISAFIVLPAVMSGISMRNAVALVIILVITAWAARYNRKHSILVNSIQLWVGILILQTLLIWIAVLIP